LLGGGAPNYTFAYAFHSVLERLAQDKPLADPKGGEFNLDSDRQMGDYCWKLANRTRITDDPLNVRYLATGALD
jgi:hypothetical protein